MEFVIVAYMRLVEAFGNDVGELARKNGGKARSLMLLGYRAQEFRLKHFPDKRFTPSKQYLSWLIMHFMRSVLIQPEKSAMTSLFIPSEPLLTAGYIPYSVEGLSAFMTGTRCQNQLLDAEDEDQGLCSFHRIFLGGAKLGLLPKPPFILYTNVACDANMITFPYISRTYGVPRFIVDVPYELSSESVAYVAGELKEMVRFIEDNTHTMIDGEKLKETMRTTTKTYALYQQYLSLSATKYVPGDVTSQMYEIMTNHMLLGSRETLKYWTLSVKDFQDAGPNQGLKILWIHTIPFAQMPVRQLLNFNPKVHVVSCEMSYESMLVPPPDPEDPYGSMANRMVYSAFNSSVDHRIEQVLRLQSIVHADGAVFFGHWGCKATLASSSMMKKALEDAGLPCLFLDGDGCDMRNQSDGQTETRLQAFVELLEAR